MTSLLSVMKKPQTEEERLAKVRARYEYNKAHIAKWQNKNKVHRSLVEKKRRDDSNGAVAARARELRASRRVLVLSKYGGACACCGESNEVFLQVDHVNNDGATERRSSKTVAREIYQHIITQGFPKSKYQILCANCNQAKARLGVCPHRRKNPKSA